MTYQIFILITIDQIDRMAVEKKWYLLGTSGILWNVELCPHSTHSPLPSTTVNRGQLHSGILHLPTFSWKYGNEDVP